MNGDADQLIELFHEAKARPIGPERARFLRDACRGQPEIERQVLSLLEADKDAGDFLSSNLTNLPETLPVEKPGGKLGNYKLLEQIGEGGCGVVYLAEQEQPVRRQVALKVIKLGMDTRAVVARFEAERQALALMDHPNIARVLEAGATSFGRPYFVMELVRGIKVTEFCEQAYMPIEERLRLFVQVCQAVQHAHQKGIIHRDLKPSNILVTLHDGVPVPKVIDFGIAKATSDQPLTDKTVFTASDQFIGTPAYMSPEQAETSGLDIDTRSDIYSLGVLLYELLTGKTPFNTKELLAAGLDKVRLVIRQQEPVRPSDYLAAMAIGDLAAVAQHRRIEAQKLVSLVRGDLDWIVLKCLEKDRTHRYETASGLANDVNNHVRNEPIAARPPTTLYRLQKSFRRNKLAYGVSGVVTLALSLGLSMALWALIRERAAHNKAEAAGNLARAEAQRNEEIASFLMKSTSPGMWRGQQVPLVRFIIGSLSARVGTELTNQPGAQGDLWVTLGTGYAGIGDYPLAITNLQQAVASYRRAYGSEHARLARALVRLGKLQALNNEVSAGKTNVLLGVAIARKCRDPESLATCLLEAAKSFSVTGDPTSETIFLLREALQLRRKVVPHLLACIDATRSLVTALQALASEGKQEEAKAILNEELKEAPKDADLLNLFRTLNRVAPN